MFTAYRIGVTVALQNQVSSVLSMIARDFAKTDASAMALNRTLKEIKLLGATGLVLGGLGYAGLRLTESLVKPATEYAHQLNIMNMAGLSHAEIAKAIGDAWRNTSTVITTTATGNLRMLLDLRNVLGNLAEAQAALPIVSKIQAVMASSSESGVRSVARDNFALNMAKALDIRGKAINPATFAKEAGMMAQVITAFQGRVSPAMFQSVFAYARQAKFGLSPEFAYQILPTLMLEYAQGSGGQGGGSRGVGPALAAFSRLTLQGYINKKAMPELAQLGLINPASALQTTTTGTTIGAMKDSALAAANPFLWVQQVLMPAIEKRFGGHATKEQITQEVLGITRGNQLASQLVLEFALKSKNFLRDQGIIKGAMPYGTAYDQARRHDPDFAYTAVRRQWHNLETALGTTIIPVLIPTLMDVAKGLNALTGVIVKYPKLTRDLAVGFTALSTAMAVGGGLLVLSQGLRLVGVALTLNGLAPAALSVVASNLTAVGAGFAALAGPLGFLASIFGMRQSTLNLERQHDPLHRTAPWWAYLPGGDIAWDYGARHRAIDAERGHGSASGGGIAGLLHRLEGLLNGGLTVQMDGKEVGRIVTDHQADEARRPPSDSSTADTRLSPLWPNYVIP